MPRYFSIDDMHRQARRRVPSLAFDYIDGGAGSEASLAANVTELDALNLVPRTMVNVEEVSTEKTLFGRRWALPLGVAPIGLANVIWPGTDSLLAETASKANIAYTASTPASTSLERLHAIAGDNAWFQLYVGRSQAITDDLIDRAERVGYRTLLVTADIPSPGRRLRDMRNGFSLPFRPGVRQMLELLTHPAWSLATARAGAPRCENAIAYAAPGSDGAQALAEIIAGQTSGRLDWALLRTIRDRWPHRLIVKGVMDAADAVRLEETGVDAIVVSNHGGRQLSSAPAAVQALPAIRAAVGAELPVLFDGGVRNGEGIIKALALGADFVLAGRAFLYASGAGGADAVAASIDILEAEMRTTLRQIGCTSLEQLGPQHIQRNCYS